MLSYQTALFLLLYNAEFRSLWSNISLAQTIVRMVVPTGAASQYSAHYWQLMPSGSQRDLLSIWVGPPVINSNTPLAIAVGRGGTVLRLLNADTSASWQQYPVNAMPPNISSDLTAIVNVGESWAVFGSNGTRFLLNTLTPCTNVLDAATGKPIEFEKAYSDAFAQLWMVSTSGQMYAGNTYDCAAAVRQTVMGVTHQPAFADVARVSTRYALL